MLRKENDFLKLELSKVKEDLDKSKKHITFMKYKCDVILCELIKYADLLEKSETALTSY